jgi:hypothetical protein
MIEGGAASQGDQAREKEPRMNTNGRESPSTSPATPRPSPASPASPVPQKSETSGRTGGSVSCSKWHLGWPGSKDNVPSIPTGFRNKARGCAVFGATPGNMFFHAPNPNGVASGGGPSSLTSKHRLPPPGTQPPWGCLKLGSTALQAQCSLTSTSPATPRPSPTSATPRFLRHRGPPSFVLPPLSSPLCPLIAKKDKVEGTKSRRPMVLRLI